MDSQQNFIIINEYLLNGHIAFIKSNTDSGAKIRVYCRYTTGSIQLLLLETYFRLETNKKRKVFIENWKE